MVFLPLPALRMLRVVRAVRALRVLPAALGAFFIESRAERASIEDAAAA